MEKILTIVIPTYNMQDYIYRCLDSLIVPEEQMKQLEVLIINDGSKDNSSSIAHEYQNKYSNTFRVIDKENGNYGSCVNRGLKEAKGKYIKVLDADDWFDKDNFSEYITLLAQQDADLVFNSCNVINVNGQIVNCFTIPFMNSKSTISFAEFAKYDFFPQMHTVAYKTEILHKIGYHQTEGISYTDMEWVDMPMSAVETVSFIDLNVYNYLVGREGQTVNKCVVNKAFKQHQQIAFSLLDFAQRYVGDKIHKRYIVDKSIDYMVLLYRKHILEDFFAAKDFQQFDKIIHQKYPFAFKKVSGLRSKSLYITLWRHTPFRTIYVDMIRIIVKIKRNLI